MRRVLQSQSTPIRSGRRGRPPKQISSALAELADRFERFRREHPRGTRVPGDLRAAALAALEKGVAARELYRACGVSFGQVAAWQTRGGAGGAVSTELRGAEVTDVRVFSVVDEPPVKRAGAVIGEQELELRFGSWSVSVRLAGPGSAERG